ncbi:hydroxymethylbilane synthase [Methanocella arvoryzae]|uniref:Probable porphobilinogen deaminase n=1 Tax=Methanocella arvoryzae (strain DSM 22066 / NBRC 105507 / MRE50) TaxID=351160 RepID=HEM3_METAR|nr:hydroxymethylbilane synthase [Methanocella arvoryzae]Q0W5T2.1 RecName: Full=Probable porphobilinogen deaminase; Short=PBG; AltName: Full=Hydroxymethylbilane synthase; Short=HMBS; AltName: Full=Pre-uroporphyrinogen synthase [Methanocella arvoryzae MRE50]CAJ36261.1 porphobilinogen deaminase [Methanocella arvoryzae MRE50]
MRIGTRGSKLALAQAEKVRRLLKEQGVEATITVIKTSGDVQKDSPLYMMKGYGAFVREIDDLLLKNEVDLAVHSLKDIPTVRPENLVTAAVLKRESALDVAVIRNAERLADLPEGAVVGTSSTRRAAMIYRHYPGLVTKDIRGNVDTRLRKLRDGEYDAILLAEAGLIRLGLDLKVERLDPYNFVPAANQGVIAIVARQGTPEAEVVKELNDETTWIETRVERIIAAGLDGGCVVPMGVYATRVGDEIDVIGEVLSLDGRQQVRVRETIPVAGCEEHAKQVSEKLVLAGGLKLAEEARKELDR